MLRCKQELATAARCVAAGGGSGRSWRARERAAGEGNRAGTGSGRRVDVIPAGGGAAAVAEWRPEVAHCTGDREGQSRARAQGRRREGGVRGAYLEISETSRTSR
jgi:hypothetical protein